MKPRCIECRIKQVSQHLADRHGIGLFCSMRCAADFAHKTAKEYIACPHCGTQEIPDEFSPASKGEIRCPHCGQTFPEKAAA